MKFLQSSTLVSNNHAKISHECAKWSRWLILLQSLRWISHSHAKCSHGHAKCSKGFIFATIIFSFAQSCKNFAWLCKLWQKLILHISKGMKTPLFWHENSSVLAWFPLAWLCCFGMTVQKWWWTIKTHFSFASCIPSIQKVLQNTSQRIEMDLFNGN